MAPAPRILGFRPVLALPYRGEGPPVSCCCWFRRWAATIQPAISWTTASSRRLWWRPSSNDFRAPLPPHQVVFNAIGRCRPGPRPRLLAAQSHPGLHKAPVIICLLRCGATGRADHGTVFARAGRNSCPLTVTLLRGTAQLPRIPRHVGAPRLPFSAAGADARLPHRAPFSAR